MIIIKLCNIWLAVPHIPNDYVGVKDLQIVMTLHLLTCNYRGTLRSPNISLYTSNTYFLRLIKVVVKYGMSHWCFERQLCITFNQSILSRVYVIGTVVLYVPCDICPSLRPPPARRLMKTVSRLKDGLTRVKDTS